MSLCGVMLIKLSPRNLPPSEVSFLKWVSWTCSIIEGLRLCCLLHPFTFFNKVMERMNEQQLLVLVERQQNYMNANKNLNIALNVQSQNYS